MTSLIAPEAAARPATAARRAPATTRGRALELQGYRGLAALSTVVFHVWQQYYRYDAQGAHPPVDNPYIGALASLEVIDLFFVMSAYLLTLSYARAAIDGDAGSVRPGRVFLFRRAVRILPLYFLAVLVVWSMRNPTLPGDWRDLVEHLTFTHVFDRGRIFYTLGPTWSLSLEVAFYLALVVLGPLAVRACRGMRTRRARVALCASGCAALFALPVGWIAYAHYVRQIPHTDWPVYFGPQARFGSFAAGMALAVLLTALGDGRGRVGARWVTALSAAAFGGLYALSYLSAPENFAHTFYHPLAALLWFVLLYATLHIRRPERERVRWHGLLRARWVTAVGLISYSLYIWHEPVMLELDEAGLLPSSGAGFPVAMLLVVVVALAVGTASYWLVEYPASLLARAKGAKGAARDFYPEGSRPEGSTAADSR
ncbi:acyltransferase family protein [Streptomyces kanamyceticus]|uniref:Acyltransferase n=1 Tax=Streptomyces kanamyceticus TaxID=1967 RepID=A0A5J6GQU5_STRKN|nr:acyltransferase [Streptomyces kanamyceticus]QEU97667.1 acyltransferase [Streptomyces kanamyceticus]